MSLLAAARTPFNAPAYMGIYLGKYIPSKIHFEWLSLTKYINKLDTGDAPVYMGIYLTRYISIAGYILRRKKYFNKIGTEVHLHIWAHTLEIYFHGWLSLTKYIDKVDAGDASAYMGI